MARQESGVPRWEDIIDAAELVAGLQLGQRYLVKTIGLLRGFNGYDAEQRLSTSRVSVDVKTASFDEVILFAARGGPHKRWPETLTNSGSKVQRRFETVWGIDLTEAESISISLEPDTSNGFWKATLAEKFHPANPKSVYENGCYAARSIYTVRNLGALSLAVLPKALVEDYRPMLEAETVG